MEHAPDLLLISQYDPELGEVAAFEELVGSHGGLGGPQTEPFILHPTDWSWTSRAARRAGVYGHPALARDHRDRARQGPARDIRRACTRARGGGRQRVTSPPSVAPTGRPAPDLAAARLPALVARAVAKQYRGRVRALDGIDLDIPVGSVQPRLSDRTARAVDPDEGVGRVRAAERRVGGRPRVDPFRDRAAALDRLGYVSQRPALYRGLTVDDHVDLAGEPASWVRCVAGQAPPRRGSRHPARPGQSHPVRWQAGAGHAPPWPWAPVRRCWLS